MAAPKRFRAYGIPRNAIASLKYAPLFHVLSRAGLGRNGPVSKNRSFHAAMLARMLKGNFMSCGIFGLMTAVLKTGKPSNLGYPGRSIS